MNNPIVLILVILLLVGAFGGGHLGWYPTHYGYGGGVGLVVLLIILFLVFGGRL
jgi:hypothetical protein